MVTSFTFHSKVLVMSFPVSASRFRAGFNVNGKNVRLDAKVLIRCRKLRKYIVSRTHLWTGLNLLLCDSRKA